MGEEGHVNSPMASYVQVVTTSNQTVVMTFCFFSMLRSNMLHGRFRWYRDFHSRCGDDAGI